MDTTRLLFGVFYRIGFTPWDGHSIPGRLGAPPRDATRIRDFVQGSFSLLVDSGCLHETAT